MPRARDLVPPAFQVRSLSILGRLGGVGYRRVASWEEAVARSGGYSHAEVVQWQVSRALKSLISPIPATTQVDQRVLRLAAASLAGLSRGTLQDAPVLRVADIGGQDAELFKQLRTVLPDKPLQWTVVETPELVHALRQQGMHELRLGEDELLYKSFRDHLGNFDVSIASGVLQCLDDPWAYLATIAGNSSSVVLEYVPTINTSIDVAAIRTPTYSHAKKLPIWLFSEEGLQRRLKDLGEIALSWQCPEFRAVDGKRISFSGFLIIPH